MELEDLFIGHFRVEKIEINGRMVAFPDPKGKYRAASADLVEQALTNRKPPEGVDVQIGTTWYPIRLPRPRKGTIREGKRQAEVHAVQAGRWAEIIAKWKTRIKTIFERITK